jgi:hypothetical protein
LVRDVIVYEITSGYGVYGGLNFQAGYFIHVYLDDSTGTLSAKLTTSSVDGGGTLIGDITVGPNLFYGTTGTVNKLTTEPYYSYCEGTTLRYIGVQANVPYAFLGSTPDASECYIAPVCDLEITGTTITESSAPDAADGGIQVTATSSNGTVKYFLGRDFDYATEGIIGGLFSGLLSGTYTVWVRDGLSNCVRQVTVTITITQVYAERWRSTYDDLAGGVTRISILERAYEGEMSEVCAGESPLIIEHRGDPANPYQTIIPSNAAIQLMVRTEGQFADLFNGDDRQFKVVIYKNDVVRWTGFVIPEFLKEPYLFQPYYLTITATDGLGELSSYDFVDNSAQFTNNEGNNFVGRKKAIFLIAEILKKCPTGFGIISYFDVWETTMDPDVDPLEQMFIPTDIFYKVGVPVKCDYVLNQILGHAKAQIFMADGYWRIRRIESSVSSSKNYREFDADGVFVDDGEHANLQDLTSPRENAWWIEQSQFLNYIRNFGRFTITHDLVKDGNLLPSGNFEESDIEGDFFKGWNFFMGQTGISFGYQAVDRTDSKGAFFCKFAGSGAQNDSILYTSPIPISIGGDSPIFSGENEIFMIKAEILAILQYAQSYSWCRVAWRLRLVNTDTGDTYDFKKPHGENLQYEIITDPENEQVLNDLYLEDGGKFETFELGPFSLPFPYNGNYTIQLSFHFNNHQSGDFDCTVNFDALRAFDASVFEGHYIGKRIYVNLVDETLSLRGAYYKLTFSTEAESEPNIIRPNDYGPGFQYQWILQEMYALTVPKVTEKIVIDNLKLAFYPVIDLTPRVDPPPTVDYDQVVNPFVKPVFEDLFVLGDVPVFNNSTLVYNGFLTLADGTPTSKWAREGVEEELPILEISLNDVIAQMTNPVRTLSGKIKSNVPLYMLNSFKDYLDDKRYINTRFVTYDKRQEYEVNLIEVQTGAGGEPPVVLGAFSDGFSDGFLN